MKFKNKAELIRFVSKQTAVELENDKTNILNDKRNLLYTKITRSDKYNVLSALQKYGITYEKHLDDYYFIRVR